MGEGGGLVQAAGCGMGSRVACQVKGREESRLMLCLGGSRWTVGPNRSGEDAVSSGLGLSRGVAHLVAAPRAGSQGRDQVVRRARGQGRKGYLEKL